MSTNSIQQVNISEIITYGALILPFDKEKAFERAKVQADPETVTEQQGNIISAIENSNQKSAIEQAIENSTSEQKSSITQKVKTLATYMNDNRDKISGLVNDIGSKFSGIAVAQAIINGKVTSKEALDYLFMGFAPALGIQGSLMGYSGLNQMKDALANGSINVGAFISGFTRTLKGAKDLKDMLTKKDVQTAANIIEFDLTISHNESYQSETPDRRVQSGQSLNEYIHNMPETISVNCALQEGKRYSKEEFRAILKYLRERKETVQLVLGEEIFDSLVLTEFSPNHDCTKSGMDYTLGFKKITRSDIDTNKEVTIQKMPIKLEADATSVSSGTSKIGGLSSSVSKNAMPTVDLKKVADELASDLSYSAKTLTQRALFGDKTFIKASVDNLMNFSGEQK